MNTDNSNPEPRTMAGKRILFIDRDGTLINEAPPTYQIDSFEKVTFYPHMFEFMRRIATELDYQLVMVSNQDGLGTAAFPESSFQPVHNFIMNSLANEGIHFKTILIDRSYPEENKATRKPGTGMFVEYLDNNNYDITNSYVIGDRITDVQLAKNLNCKAIWLNNDPNLGGGEIIDKVEELKQVIALETTRWEEIYMFLKLGLRQVNHQRITNETQIDIELNLDGSGKANIKTGVGFFDHMLEQIARHGKLDLSLKAKGDLHIDEHHTIEVVAYRIFLNCHPYGFCKCLEDGLYFMVFIVPPAFYVQVALSCVAE